MNNDNGVGFFVLWHLGAGSNFTSGTLGTTWQANDTADRVSSSNVNLADTVGNYFQLTGVQLEVGEQATPFEHRSFADELQRCQRYFLHNRLLPVKITMLSEWVPQKTPALLRGLSSFHVTMRIEPSLTATASNTFFTQGFTPDGTTVSLPTKAAGTVRIALCLVRGGQQAMPEGG